MLAVPPAMAARADMRVHRRVADLLRALQGAGVDSAAALGARWERDSQFLHAELAGWVRKGGQQLLGELWDRLVAEGTAGR